MTFRKAFIQELEKEAFWKELFGLVKRNKATDDVMEGMKGVSDAIADKINNLKIIAGPSPSSIKSFKDKIIDQIFVPQYMTRGGRTISINAYKPDNIAKRFVSLPHKVLSTQNETEIRHQLAKMHEMFEASSINAHLPMYTITNNRANLVYNALPEFVKKYGPKKLP